MMSYRTIWLIIWLFTSQGSEMDMSPLKKETSYIYAPGLGGSPIVIGRYCHHFVADTGEVITGARGGDIFHDGTRVTAVTFPEINESSRSMLRTHIAPLISPRVFRLFFGITVTQNTPQQASVMNYLPEFNRMNIGQAEDQKTLYDVLEKHQKTFLDTDLVMFGDSRGAAATFNVIAAKRPRITCAILEGIFDDMPHLLVHTWRWENKGSRVENCLHTILKALAKGYKDDGPFPSHYVDQFPHNLPIMMVTSLCDEIVPYQSTMRLYCMLSSRGHQNIRLLILKKAWHKTYMLGEEKDLYQAVVHAFYRFAGVEHDPVLADQGQSTFEETQPSVVDLITQYRLHTKPCCCTGVFLGNPDTTPRSRL